ncbi:glycosyltransferase [Candidatus Roizmanbacteria bacterium]|nr:glycosyltransferase [Candidatus Roizmanbacteria bacterium]
MLNTEITVIIPSYKNLPLLIKNLQHNLAYLKNYSVIVVNDDPSRSIREELTPFSQITLVENKKNYGFGITVNEGVKHTHTPYLMLLNSDVLLNDTSFHNALAHFETNPNLFGVSFAQKEKDGSIVGKNTLYWEKGFVRHKKADSRISGDTGWLEGGTCILDRSKFNQLKGFDKCYAPFYWEDIDLSYRAKKNGYTVFFDASILVEHHHESTIRSYFESKKIEQIAYRNSIIFIWKNISDSKMRTEHGLYLLKTIFVLISQRKFYLVNAILQASKSLKYLFHQKSKSTIISDITILKSVHA